MNVREGPKGKKNSLCTYVRYICYKKLKFLSSYSLENDKELFHTHFLIKIYILEDFGTKEWPNFEIVKYLSLDHGAGAPRSARPQGPQGLKKAILRLMFNSKSHILILNKPIFRILSEALRTPRTF